MLTQIMKKEWKFPKLINNYKYANKEIQLTVAKMIFKQTKFNKKM